MLGVGDDALGGAGAFEEGLGGDFGGALLGVWVARAGGAAGGGLAGGLALAHQLVDAGGDGGLAGDGEVGDDDEEGLGGQGVEGFDDGVVGGVEADGVAFAGDAVFREDGVDGGADGGGGLLFLVVAAGAAGAAGGARLFLLDGGAVEAVARDLDDGDGAVVKEQVAGVLDDGELAGQAREVFVFGEVALGHVAFEGVALCLLLLLGGGEELGGGRLLAFVEGVDAFDQAVGELRDGLALGDGQAVGEEGARLVGDGGGGLGVLLAGVAVFL